MKKTNPVIDILIVGDEILADPGHDTNSAWLVRMLESVGFAVARIAVAGDDADLIGSELTSRAGVADAVLVTGGLGPTSDDLTIAAAAQAFGLELVLDDDALKAIEEKFARRKWVMSESNSKQALLPAGADALPNSNGTAPGVVVEHAGTMFVFMPGVPLEMTAMFEAEVLPRLTSRFEPRLVTTAVLQLTGIGESTVYDCIRAIPGVAETARYYPNPRGLVVRIVAPADSGFDAGTIADAVAERLGGHVFSRAEETLEEVVGRMLARRGLTIAVAESCTGGLICDRLTDVPGSSAYMMAGMVTYANEAKTALLGVTADLIAAHGAVSEPVAAAMAEGIRTRMGTDIGVSTTGIAGPGGGSAEKPVGLVCMALAVEGRTITKQLQFGSNRRINKGRFSQAVLDMIRHYLEGQSELP